MRYDIVIVGGGPSGLSCAITIGSAVEHEMEFAKDKKVLVIDNGTSDLKSAKLNNVPGIKRGTLGKELLEQIKNQAIEYPCIEIIEDTVKRVSKNGNFHIETSSGKDFEADVLVLATGFKAFDIEGIELNVVENPLSPKPNRVMIKTNEKYEAIDKGEKPVENLYVAGLLAGFSSMFACAAGSGVQVAINILNKYAGKPIVIHDVPDKS
ncbi:NAD(P)/FAD-dependent oxidoreductase [Hydrogenobaculum acidophilum]